MRHLSESTAAETAPPRDTRRPPNRSPGIATATESKSPLFLSRQITELVFGPVESRGFDLRYWDSGVTEFATIPAFTLILSTPGALRALLLPPSQLRMAAAFCSSTVRVEGDLIAATEVTVGLRERLQSAATWWALYRLARRLPRETSVVHAPPPGRRRRATLWRRHSQTRDAAVVRQHYDLGNDFYRLWLDRRMIYSCAYFDEGVTGIDAAQTAKVHHICRKLRLEPGDRLLDIGCGWGGLLMLAAQQYGVEGVGVTLSPSQAAEANRRIADAGLEHQCVVQVRDYRALTDGESFDKIVSVGMCEHVGRRHLAEYFSHVRRLLRPGGLFLNHCLTEGQSAPSWIKRHLWRDGVFLDRYVFPDTELPLLEELANRGRHVGLEVRDVEQLREHYVLTVRAWLDQLAQCRDQALRIVDPWTYEAWRLYLAGAAAGLAAGRMGLTQVLYSRPDSRGVARNVPLTRRHLYG